MRLQKGIITGSSLTTYAGTLVGVQIEFLQ